MQGKIQVRFAVLAALAALVAALVPATLAAGSHGSFSGVVPGGVVLLNMGNGPNADIITFETETQPIATARNNCTNVDSGLRNGNLLKFTPFGNGTVSLGEAKDQIGVQSDNDGAGENCVRMDPTESMTLALGSYFPAGTVMGGFDVDVQLKFNSIVRARTYLGAQMQDELFLTGEGLSDNGPDSQDNRRWAHVAEPNKEFDRIQFQATQGTFSIGGGRYLNEAGIFDTTSTASQFAIGPVFDGQITCGQTEPIGIEGIDTTYGAVTMHAFDADASTPEVEEWVLDPDCELKPFFSDTSEAGLAFVPELENTRARYTLDVTVENQEITTYSGTDTAIPPGTITSLIAEYNETGDLTLPFASDGPVQACQGEPIVDQSDPGYNAFWSQDGDVMVTDSDTGLPVTLLPPDGEGGLEPICFYSATVEPTGVAVGTEYWSFYLEDDPGLGFR